MQRSRSLATILDVGDFERERKIRSWTAGKMEKKKRIVASQISGQPLDFVFNNPMIVSDTALGLSAPVSPVFPLEPSVRCRPNCRAKAAGHYSALASANCPALCLVGRFRKPMRNPIDQTIASSLVVDGAAVKDKLS